MLRDPLSRVRPRRLSDCEPSAISENVGNRYVRATCTWSKAFSRSSCTTRIARLLASAALIASSSVSTLVVEGTASGICAETEPAAPATSKSKASKKFAVLVEELSGEFTPVISNSRDTQCQGAYVLLTSGFPPADSSHSFVCLRRLTEC